jgi:hypothetical protein
MSIAEWNTPNTEKGGQNGALNEYNGSVNLFRAHHTHRWNF